MEILDWIKKSVGSGDGDGYGYGDGSGSGSGDGYGSGYGNDYGYGDGYGYGPGSGNGSGNDYGYGDGYVKKLNEHNIYNIDDINTIITSTKGNIAKGFILNKDLTLAKTYVVKTNENNYYAHGITLAEAISSLENKIFDDIDINEKINLFLKGGQHE